MIREAGLLHVLCYYLFPVAFGVFDDSESLTGLGECSFQPAKAWTSLLNRATSTQSLLEAPAIINNGPDNLFLTLCVLILGIS